MRRKIGVHARVEGERKATIGTRNLQRSLYTFGAQEMLMVFLLSAQPQHFLSRSGLIADRRDRVYSGVYFKYYHQFHSQHRSVQFKWPTSAYPVSTINKINSFFPTSTAERTSLDLLQIPAERIRSVINLRSTNSFLE